MSTSRLASVIYRRMERQISALKQAGPFGTAKRSEYYQRAEEIRALYRQLRNLEATQTGVQVWTYRSS